jgi:hypothetical protein
MKLDIVVEQDEEKMMSRDLFQTAIFAPAMHLMNRSGKVCPAWFVVLRP